MKHPLAGKIVFSWAWDPRNWGVGYSGPVPALPYLWRWRFGPVSCARVTTNEGTRWTRQRRRKLQRQIRKAAKRA